MIIEHQYSKNQICLDSLSNPDLQILHPCQPNQLQSFWEFQVHQWEYLQPKLFAAYPIFRSGFTMVKYSNVIVSSNLRQKDQRLIQQMTQLGRIGA